METALVKTIIHKANTRGEANHGWLHARHTFSFANYYNPERINFGVLRVLNDDLIQGKAGFGTHPHDNMEIISIPVSGSLEHKDSMGNHGVINSNEVQVMSAGTGIMHSEFNPIKDTTNLLQIWVIPNKQNVTPRYDQISYDFDDNTINTFKQVVSPNKEDAGTWIHQDAWFYIGEFNEKTNASIHLNKEGNGFYVFVIEGDAEVNDHPLNRRDGMGIWQIDSLDIVALPNSKVLVMEIPMNN